MEQEKGKTVTTSPRIAVYGRYSTSEPNPTLSADQVAACMPLVRALGGRVAATYLDPETSGCRRQRPGLGRMLTDIRHGKVDIVVAEALDRLARGAEHFAWLDRQLKLNGVRLFTVTEHENDDVKLAVTCMLGADSHWLL